MGTFLFHGIEIAYTSVGEGKPFLFLHGLGGDSAAVTSAYTPRAGIRIVTFDFPGHGKSGYSGDGLFSFAAFTDLLFALQDALDLTPCVVGGISMGAAVALRAALLKPERFTRLVLVRPAWLNAPMEPAVRNVYAVMARFLRMENGLAAYRASDLCALLSADYPALESSMQGLLAYARGAETAGKFLRMPLDQPYDSPAQLASLRLDTLVVGTKQDFIHPLAYAETLASGIPGAAFVEILSKSVSAASHRRELKNAIDAFLSDGL